MRLDQLGRKKFSEWQGVIMPQTIANHPCILPALFKSILSIQGSVWTFPFPKQSFHLLVYPEPPWVWVFCAGLAPRALPTFSSLLADIRNSPVLTPRSSFVYSGQRSCLLTGQRGTKPNHVWRVHFGMAEFHRRSQGSHCGSSQLLRLCVPHLLCSSFMCSTAEHGGRFGSSLEKVIGSGKRKLLMLG